jgi:hypothetical protein
MKSGLVAIVLVVLVAGSLGIGYFVGSTQRVATTVSVYAPFKLVFQQIATCQNMGYIAPWKVVLSDGESMTAPPNATLPGYYGVGTTNPSTITFYVANGNYTFSVTPAGPLTPASGNVTVDGQDVVVSLGQVIASCGSSTTSTG